LLVSCPDALTDGTVVDAGQVDQLIKLAATLKWEGGYGSPRACHRTVRLTCGPDLDRDGDPEAIVQVGWWSAVDGDDCGRLVGADDHWIVSYTFLATRHLGAWRAVGPLAVGIDADEAEARRPAYFVRRAHGELAVRTEWSTVSSDSGCRIGGYEVFAVRSGAVQRIEVGDNSLPCIMCDCDGR
jgi:hypothetical protein